MYSICSKEGLGIAARTAKLLKHYKYILWFETVEIYTLQ